MSGAASGANPSWDGAADVYATSYRDLLRVAFVLTGSSAVAEDVVHDVFCRIGPRITSLETPVAYLRVAVVNQCRSLHRRTLRAPQPTAPADADLGADLVELQDALQHLRLRQRTAIVLRYLCDLPDGEIAEIIGCRPATVRSLIHRGLADLRRAIS